MRRTRFLELAAVLLLAWGLHAALALRSGQDASWDLLNYHYYNGYSLVEGRLDRDIQPAMRQTFFHPAMDAGFYLLAANLPSRAVTLLVAGFQALLVVAVYGCARLLLSADGVRPGLAVAGAAGIAAVGALSPLHLGQLGASTGDSTSGVLVAAALLALVAAALRPRRRTTFAIAAGALAGAATGLKLTNGPYLVGLFAALALAPLAARHRMRMAAGFGVAAVAATLLVGGWWWLRVNECYGNPIFPQFNDVFRSSLVPPIRFDDGDYRGRTAGEVLLYPIAFNRLTGGSVNGQRFEDPRVFLVLLLSAAGAAAIVVRRLRRRRGSGPPAEDGDGPPGRAARHVIVWFALASYVAWLVAFSIGRYTLVLEVAVLLVAFASLRTLRLPRPASVGAVAALALLLVLTRGVARQGRTTFGPDLFAAEVAAPERFEESMVVLAGEAPLAYAIPAFPRSARFVRIGGNLFYPIGAATAAERYDNGIGRRLDAAIRAHDGPLFVMAARGELEGARAALARFDVVVDPDREVAFRDRVWPDIVIRPARRLEAPDE